MRLRVVLAERGWLSATLSQRSFHSFIRACAANQDRTMSSRSYESCVRTNCAGRHGVIGFLIHAASRSCRAIGALWSAIGPAWLSGGRRPSSVAPERSWRAIWRCSSPPARHRQSIAVLALATAAPSSAAAPAASRCLPLRAPMSWRCRLRGNVGDPVSPGE